MRWTLRSLALALVPVLGLALAAGGAPVLAQAQKSFVRDDLLSDSVRLEASLRKETPAALQGKAAAQLRTDAATAINRRNVRQALTLYGAAVGADARDASAWLGYARAALAVDPKDSTERWELRERASVAAYAAYQRATSRPEEATALALLGETYAAREVWRPSLDAYRASLALADDTGVRSVYEALREQHGFRITDYKVDSDSAAPRVCFQFSDPLARGKVDFAPYVAVSGTANAAISAEDQQLCVDGLKHGERYAIVLRQGLPSSVGENLLKAADYEIYVRDRSPQVRFTGKNYVLPRTGQEGIPVVSVNTPSVDVSVFRVGDRNLISAVRGEFLQQLGGWSARTFTNESGQKIWSGTLAVKNDLNKDVVTAFPVSEAVGKMEPGVYVMMAKATGTSSVAATASDDGGDGEEDIDYTLQATQWFVVSDLGLTAMAGDDGVHVLVRSLASAEPLKDVEIRLVARNNEILATKPTDGTGHAAFDPGLARGTGGLAPGLVVATDASGDYGFLDLGTAAFDLTDRGVKGRVAPKGLDAFLYTERGVYRSGETVFVTALLRDPVGQAVSGMPLTLVVKRPDGVEYRRTAVEDQGLGGRALSVPLLSGAARGTWRVLAYADPKGASIGETSFLVEDYVPERLDVTLTPQEKTLGAGEPARIDIAARYLYGAPGSDLDVTGEYTVQAASGPAVPGLDGYAVGLQDEAFEAVSAEVEEPPTTDAKGRATAVVALPEVTAPKPVEAKIVLRVGETGGRAVERSVTIPIRPRGPVVGVKKLFGDLGQGGTATFDVVYAAPDGQRLARPGMPWTLYRIDQRYQWFNQDGRWSFEAVKSTRRVADGTVDVGTDAPARIATAVEWGSYRLEVRGGGETGDTSIDFDVGWAGTATAETPDMLDVSLDKAAYADGDTMSLKMAPRFAGKATVAIVSDRVQDLRVVDLKAGDNTVQIPVKGGWGAGAYVVALAHRPLDQAAKRMPGRALGVAWFAVDEPRHKLSVSIAGPAKIRPRGTLELPVTVAGLASGEEAYVTVAAVDVGILNLTKYETPDPASFFFGQRQLGAEIRDLYGYLIDGMQGTRGAIRSGGDEAGLSGDASPPTQAPLARYSGVVKVGPDGKATVSFDIPAFNGSVRVMAVAWTKGRAGSSDSEVIIRDPVVVQGTLPRFLNLGDQSRFFLQVDNVEGPAGDYTVDLDVRGPVVIPASAAHSVVRLEAGGKAQLTIPVTAAGIGTAQFDLRLTGQGVDAGQGFVLGVQPGSPTLYRRTVRNLAPGETLTVSSDLLADYLPGTGGVSVAASPFGALDVPALLQALDRYPFGCSEQLVSRAMPLLYVNRLAAIESLNIDDKVDERVRDTIERVLARQDSSGSFGLWSVGGTDDLWLDSFVTDFLTRARERGFAVPQRAFDMALDRIRNSVSNATDVEAGKGQDLAYGIYVLARNGRPVMGDLRYLADTKLADFGSSLAKAQIGAALALLGDKGRAQKAFAAALQGIQGVKDDRVSRADYGSKLRDGAGILALAAESNASRDQLVKASAVVEEARSATPGPGGTHTSTQENTWMVLAAASLSKDAEAMAITLDGVRQPGALYRTFRAPALDGRQAVIGNGGQSTAQVVLTTSGHPMTQEPAASQGYAIERTFYTLDGKAVDPSQVKQNSRMVVVLKVTEPEAKWARVVLVDQLPAGLEIDNPNLVDSGTVGALDWLKQDVEPAATEYRDDRFVAAIDRDSSQPAIFTLAYMVRAVSPGRYVQPPATVEDMYRPERFGRTAYGSVEVTAAK